MATRKKRTRRKGKTAGGVSLFALLIVLALFLLDRQGIVDFQSMFPVPAANPSVVSADGERLEVIYFDVGQGDSELLRIPKGDGSYHHLLIDSGESGYAEGLISSLEDMGVKTLDTVVVTHPHSDHMGGMASILRHFTVGALYMPETAEQDTPTTRVYEDLLDAVEEQSIPMHRLEEGGSLGLPDTVKVRIFSPEAGRAYGELNNYSGVIRIAYGNTSFLFTGDAEALVEKEILDKGYQPGTDVLHLGHHGSSTSSTEDFLRAVSPDFAVISCGKDNKYGHPHKEVLDRLNALGCTVYRTDENGTIAAYSDGNTVAFETGARTITP